MPKSRDGSRPTGDVLTTQPRDTGAPLVDDSGDSRTNTATELPIVTSMHSEIRARLELEDHELARLYTEHLARFTSRKIRMEEDEAEAGNLSEKRKTEIRLATEQDYGSIIERNARTKRQNQDLEKKIKLDELTGARNQVGVADAYEIIRQKNKEGIFTGKTVFVRLDLDGFKRVNDTQGHPEGDRVLKQVVGSLQTPGLVRPTDLVGRYGGDEFGMILTDVKVAEGMTLEETIQKILKRVLGKIEEVNSTLPEGISITASMGYHVVENDDDTFETLDKLADDAAVESKKFKGFIAKGGERIINQKNIAEFRQQKAVELKISLKELEVELTIAAFRHSLERGLADFEKEVQPTPEVKAAFEAKMEEAIELYATELRINLGLPQTKKGRDEDKDRQMWEERVGVKI